MLTKEKLLEMIENLPDSFSLEDVIERIVLLHKIEIGLEQIKSGEVYTEEEAKRKLKKWLLK